MKLNHDIPFSTTAYLLLLEIGSPGNFERKLKIELDRNNCDIRNVGELFQGLFEFTRKKNSFKEIRKWIIGQKALRMVTGLIKNNAQGLLETFIFH